MNQSIQIQQVASTDDLGAICKQMQPGLWGDDNEMDAYEPKKLRAFLDAGGILLLAKDGDNVAGVIVAHILPDPSGKNMFFVFSLDTHPNYRRQGVATTLMNKCRDIAKEQGLSEVWIIANADNQPANSFYQSLKPDEAEPSVMYAYKVQ
jgi:ribosomal protein S18 acetylase RimI-like enzyme